LAKRDSRHKQPQSGPEKAFGQALREFRKKTGLSQEQLALDADFDRTYISLLERGVQSPTLRTVVRLAEILEKELQKILDINLIGPFLVSQAAARQMIRQGQGTPGQQPRTNAEMNGG